MSFVKKLLLFKKITTMFDEYQALKEDYDAILLQLTEKDETIQGLQDCKQNLEDQVLKNVEKKIVVDPGSLFLLPPLLPLIVELFVRRLMLLSFQAHPLLLHPLMLFVSKMLLIYALRLMIVLFLPALKNTLQVLGPDCSTRWDTPEEDLGRMDRVLLFLLHLR
jgi:hypothetical protein